MILLNNLVVKVPTILGTKVAIVAKSATNNLKKHKLDLAIIHDEHVDTAVTVTSVNVDKEVADAKFKPISNSMQLDTIFLEMKDTATKRSKFDRLQDMSIFAHTLHVNNMMSSSVHCKSLNDIIPDLSEQSMIMLKEQNLGGNSVASEVLSHELISNLLKQEISFRSQELGEQESQKLGFVERELSETMIKYSKNSKRIDYVLKFKFLEKETFFGVSVTRAIEGEFEEQKKLLKKKYKGIVEASKTVSEDCAWSKSLLHVFTLPKYSKDILEILKKIKRKQEKKRCLVIVIVTVIPDQRIELKKSIFGNQEEDFEMKKKKTQKLETSSNLKSQETEKTTKQKNKGKK